MPSKSRRSGTTATSKSRTNPKLAEHFCRCIKAVAPKFGGMAKGEGAAIAICVKSILQSKGRTLKRFRCKEGASITTQKAKSKTRSRSRKSKSRKPDSSL